MVTLALRSIRAHVRRALAAAIAVLLGVGFLTATLVVGDSMRAGFADAFVAGNDGTDVVVRSSTRVGSNDMVLDEGTVPATVLDELRSLPEVRAGVLQVSGLAQIISADGAPIGGGGPPTLGGNWIDDPELSPWRLADGRAPDAPGEVVIDRASARSGGLQVGSTTTIRTPEAVGVTVVGIATFGDADSQGPSTQVFFDTVTAQTLLLDSTDRATAIRLAASQDVAESDLVERLHDLLPDGSEAITGTELAAEQFAELEDDFLGFFQAMLMVFASVGLLVATLTIHNTLSIIVTQRSQESALLRALGASRRQVIGTVAAESLAIGVVASLTGLVAGLGLAALALWGMDAAGFGTPGGMTWSTTSLVTGLMVGVGVTAAASVVPAVTASRVPPLAAVRAVAVDRSHTSRLRLGVGVVFAVLALAAVWGSTRVDGLELQLAGAGILSAIVATLLAGPAIAVPVATTIGWPLARLRGRSGELARRNAVRNPRRTANTSTSLMIGVGVVVLFMSIASSMTAYLDRTLASTFRGDLVIETDSFSGPGLGTGLAPALAALDEVQQAVSLSFGVAQLANELIYPTVADPIGLDDLLDLGVVHGSIARAAESGVAVSRHYAADHDLAVGDTLELTIGGRAETSMGIGAIYAHRDLAGDVIVEREAWLRTDAQLSEQIVMIRLTEGTDLGAGRAAVAAVSAAQAAPLPIDRDEYVDRVAGEIDQVLAMVFALMAVAGVIAVMGIGNTMSLSIHERTRELGLLRAIGMNRSRVRSAIRWESVIVATFGALTGAALGCFGAWAALRAVATAGELAVGFTVPTRSLITVIALGASSGVIAGFRPARRAARIDVLDAIATV
jgi:putative ABC transport system permease protein